MMSAPVHIRFETCIYLSDGAEKPSVHLHLFHTMKQIITYKTKK